MRIGDARTARLFMEDSPKRRLLLSLVRRARTVSEIARGEDMDLGRAHYIVSDFVKRGLVAVEREEKRGGRPIKHDRSTARSFQVPLEYVSGSPGAGLSAEIRARLDGELSRSDDEGVIFYTDPDGDPRVSWFGDRGRRKPVAEFWQILKLRESDALELISEMETLLQKYQGRAGNGPVFLIHSAIVPRRPA